MKIAPIRYQIDMSVGWLFFAANRWRYAALLGKILVKMKWILNHLSTFVWATNAFLRWKLTHEEDSSLVTLVTLWRRKRTTRTLTTRGKNVKRRHPHATWKKKIKKIVWSLTRQAKRHSGLNTQHPRRTPTPNSVNYFPGYNRFPNQREASFGINLRNL